VEDLLLLDKIKHSERINKENIKCLRGKIVIILKSQNGSRILQNSLLNDSYMVIKTILTEVEDHLSDLMVDPYANYFCQKLYEHLKLQDRLIFLKKVCYYNLESFDLFIIHFMFFFIY